MPPYAPPQDCEFFMEMPMDEMLQVETMLSIMGKEGKVFKAITYESGCEYIWWNAKKNVIEIWSHEMPAVHDAHFRLMERITKFESKQVLFGNFTDRVLYGLA